MRWLRSAGLAVSLCGLPHRVTAQLFASLDANAARATYDAYLPSAVYTLAPSVGFAYRGIRAGVDGAFSTFETGHGSAIVALNAAVGGPIAGPAHWEIGGEGSALWYRSTPPVESGLIIPRLRFDDGPLTGWIGGAAGSTDNDSVLGQFVGRGDAGVSYALPHFVPTFTVATTRAGVAHYTDVGAFLQSGIGRFGVDLTVGARSGALLGGAAKWFNGEARLTVVDGVALVFGGGSYPADLVRGAPGAHYIGGGIRVSDSFRFRKGPPPIAHISTFNGLYDVMPDAHTLRFEASANAHVDLMADFTNWQAMPMTEVRPGIYQLTLRDALLPGSHRVNIRVDNGDWGVPRELPPVTDDFGGTAGSLVVP